MIKIILSLKLEIDFKRGELTNLGWGVIIVRENFSQILRMWYRSERGQYLE